MAGDGGRAPDVSEQRAEGPFPAFVDEWLCSTCGGRLCRGAGEEPPHNRPRVSVRYYRTSAPFPAPDPASVLAALLAEQPDATIAALETLMTNDEAMDEAAAALSALDHSEADLPHSERSGPYEYARFMFVAACRSLRPKAPKEDRDA